MKPKIIAILSRSDTIVSGEQISRRLGISRVAVWKHIRGLRQAGFEIEATAKGYRLVGLPDTPYPWTFGPRSNRVHYFPQVSSTMDAALEMARKGAENFSVVVADIQTSGRGRLQRSWRSEAGGLYFTLILRPDGAPAQAPLINLAAAVDLAFVLEDLYGIAARVKWPNDVMVDGRKIAGILAIMEAETDRIHFVNLGIGINVNHSPALADQPVTSISRITGRPVSRSQLLSAFLDAFESRIQRRGLTGIIDQWRRLTFTLGKQVKIQTPAGLLEGLAVDIEPDGALIIQTADGTRRPVIYGDCLHR